MQYLLDKDFNKKAEKQYEYSQLQLELVVKI